jgi:hypothetical protein
MESVDAKLARAREHVKSLEQAVADYTRAPNARSSSGSILTKQL